MVEKIDEETHAQIIAIQRSEITEYHIYKKLAQMHKNDKNKKILLHLSRDEKGHYEAWKKYTGEDSSPSNLKIWFYITLSRLLGLTFGLKLMELGEELAQETYDKLAKKVPLAKTIQKDENEHEMKIINMINEDHLKYVGSIVLGLNDALVELTGALAGLTFALQNIKLVAVAGLVIGIAASFSMAASEYLSTKSEGDKNRDPVKAAFYTGLAYVVTVFLLVTPYLFLSNIYMALVGTLVLAVLIIATFTFYISVAQEISFKERFIEMAGISLGVAVLSFIIGMGLRMFFNVEV